MLKSVFAKYVTVFMTIIALGFAVLSIIVSVIVRNYSFDTKVEVMGDMARLSSAGVEAVLDDTTPSTFSASVSEYGVDRLSAQFSVFADDNDMAILLLDKDGTVLFTVDGGNEFSALFSGNRAPEGLLAVLSDNSGELWRGKAEKRDIPVMILGDSIQNSTGECCGYVAVCSRNTHWLHTAEDLTETVIVSALFVLLASLMAAYVLTERTMGPLREISNAARNFAAGNFNVRVSVRGQDEVSELAEAFNQMADSLENLEKMRNSFMANVSHDLRSPMTTIAGFIDSIRDGVIPPEEQDHYLQIISLEVQRLSRLVSSLLDLSRIQAGDRKFTMKPFDICEMGRLILISFEQKIEKKSLDVRFLCDEDRMMVNADHDAIYQLFYNICHNAVKFSKEGGVLRICITAKEKKVQVAVFNEGMGIPTEDLPFVFERFYKSDKSRGLDRTGLGLGLFIGKTIIKAHGEKIWAESTPGENCEFFFTLARAPHGA